MENSFEQPMYNLFIAYDLYSPGQRYKKLETRINGLGSAHRVQKSLFFVRTTKTPKQAYEDLHRALDTNDKLAVIDARTIYKTKWKELDNFPVQGNLVSSVIRS